MYFSTIKLSAISNFDFRTFFNAPTEPSAFKNCNGPKTFETKLLSSAGQLGFGA